MTIPIQSIGVPPVLADPAAVAPASTGSTAGAFQNVLENAVNHVEGLRMDANNRIQSFLSGEGEELHTVALATQRAELSLEMFQQVRNKVVQAYQEVMRMQI